LSRRWQNSASMAPLAAGSFADASNAQVQTKEPLRPRRDACVRPL
jgi:hypothetical protein